MKFGKLICIAALLGASAAPASAESWFAGDWYLKVGGAVLTKPKFDGADKNKFAFQPMISVGKAGPSARFSSRNDNISFALVDTGFFRAGAAGKLIFKRDEGDHSDLRGLSQVKMGGELGGFAELYVSDFARIRGEVRHGIRTHDAVVVDVAADAFFNMTDTIQLSGGPRLSMATKDYFETYYGVDAAESLASGLAPYSPGGGIKSIGAGGAVTWKTTDQITTSVFAEYERLMGPAAKSSLVREKGSKNQLTVGASATYRFDFSFR
jgi:outer membrane protein